MTLLKDKLGWKSYGGKHHESIYTRFYQGVVLPQKFNVDKRYGHLSDLINAKQISKDEALKELEQETYDVKLQEQDKEYVCKKLGLSIDEFEQIMSAECKTFESYPNSYGVVQFLRNTVNKLRGLGLYPK
jgi:hypothetical protein